MEKEKEKCYVSGTVSNRVLILWLRMSFFQGCCGRCAKEIQARLDQLGCDSKMEQGINSIRHVVSQSKNCIREEE